MGTMQEKLDAAARKHFQRRAEESRALAELPAFRSLRDQFLRLAQQYETLASAGQVSVNSHAQVGEAARRSATQMVL